MRYLMLCALAAVTSFGQGFGNWNKWTANATQAGRPMEMFPTFAVDELCDYPRPFVDGVAVAEWQTNVYSRWPASALCPSGSVKKAWVLFHYDQTNAAVYTVDYRNSANACHLGNLATCEAAAYNQAGMLARSWEATMDVSAWPASTTATPMTVNARSMLSAGKWSYLHLRGPLATRVIVEDRTPARSEDWGWKETRMGRVTATLTSSGTSFAVGADWSAITRPFKVQINSEIISICFATYNALTQQTTLTVGTTSGVNTGCATTAGRAQDGTSASNHYADELRVLARVRNAALTYQGGFTGTGSTTFQVNDASAINDVTLLKLNFEVVRVCNKSANTLTVGLAAWGCAANSAGRAWIGSRFASKTTDGTSGGTYIVNGGVDNWSTLTDVWSDTTDTRYHALHPVFVLTFWNNWPAVGIEYHLVNAWSDRLQDQYYDISYGDSGGTVHSIAAVMHKAMTIHRYPDGPVVGTYTADIGDRKVWDGTPPASIRMDYNLPYLRYTGMVSLDPTIVIDAAAVGTLVGANNRSHSSGTAYGWLNSDKAVIPHAATWFNLNSRQNCASIYKNWSAPGARPDIAPVPLWHSTGLYAMASAVADAEKWAEGFYGVSACAGYIPYHVWEGTDSSAKFCFATDTPYKSCTTAPNADVPAFGYPWSIDARPQSFLTFDQAGQTNAAARLIYQGDQSYNNWTLDGNGHWVQQAFMPWLLSGDWLYERSMLDEGAYSAMTSNSNATGRNGSWGWPNQYNMSRPISWFLRTMALAAAAQQNGSPAEQYFTAKIQNWTAVEEGRYNMTTGSYYEPCPNTRWCWGRTVQMLNAPTTVNSVPGLGNVASWGWNEFGNANPQYVYHVKSFWMDNYGVASMGWGINQGLTFLSPLLNAVYFRDNVDRTLRADYNAYTNGEYRDPFIPCTPQGVAQPVNCSTQTFPSGAQRFYDAPDGYAAMAASWNNTAKNKILFDNDHDKTGGYSVIFSAAGQFTGGVRTGTNAERTGYHAREWQNFNIRFKQNNASTPMWTFDPEYLHALNLYVYPRPAGTLIFVFNSPDGGACSYLLSGSKPVSSLTADDVTVPAGALQRKVTLTSQASGNKFLRVTCGNSARSQTVQFTQP